MSYRIYLIIAFILITVFGGFFLVWPKYQGILGIQSEIDQAEVDIQQGEQYFTELRQTADKLEQYRERIALIDSALPAKVYLPHLYDYLQQACSQNGVVLQGLGSDFSNIKDTKIREIDISLTVLGTYSSFKNLLDDLETSHRLFSIKRVDIGSGGGEPFNFNLNISTYAY